MSRGRELADAVGHYVFMDPAIEELVGLPAEGFAQSMLSELIQEIRNSSVYTNIPIIIMSAFVGVREIAGFLETGATFYQPKPIDIKKMESDISKCLQRT